MAKNSIIEYTGDGSTIQYTINFTGGYTLESHVFCQVNNEVDGSSDPIYRALTFVSEGIVDIGGTVPGVGEPIVFQRITPIDAPVVDFEDGVTFTEEDIDAGFEQVLFGIQEAQDNLADAEDTEAAKDAAEVAKTAAEVAQTAAELSETNAAADLVLTNADVVSTAADVVTTNADAASTAADVLSTNADVVSTSADAAATAADVLVTTADVISSEASKVAAELAESNASTSASDAEAAYDLFDDRFLGAKSTDPSVDNDGDALQTGTLYFNTSTNSMRVYDGADWDNITTTVSRVLYEYTATAGQTVFTGVDREGNSLTTGGTFLNVFINGLRLTPVDDYTYTGSSVTITTGANVNDEVLIEALTTFDVVNSVLVTDQTLTDAEKSQARNNIGAGLLSGFRNKIINGNFDIWQRDTSQTSSGYGSDDRWSCAFSGGSITHSQQEFTVGQTDVPNMPRYFSRSAVGAGSAAGDLNAKFQKIEDVRTLSGKTATLTFYAKAAAAIDMVTEFEQNFGTGGSPSTAVNGISNLISLTTAWQKFSFTVSIPSISGKTIGTNDNSSLNLLFWFSSGTDYDARALSIGHQSGTFDIAHISLVEGDATLEDDPFEARHIGQELALCQRFYREIGDGVAETSTSFIRISSSTNFYRMGYTYPKMRSSPSHVLTYSNIHKPNVAFDTVASIAVNNAYNGGFNMDLTPTTDHTVALGCALTAFKTTLDAEL